MRVGRPAENGVDVNGKWLDGWTALHNASANGNLEVVNTLLSSGANVLATDDYGWTALHNASANGRVKVVNTLLSSGANILATIDDGYTPLHLAAFNNQYDVCLVLLQHGASVEMKNKDNRTPLDDAKRRGHHKVAHCWSHMHKRGEDLPLSHHPLISSIP